MDTDVLASAEEVQPPEGVAQRVVYKIASPAQWSDGTPDVVGMLSGLFDESTLGLNARAFSTIRNYKKQY